MAFKLSPGLEINEKDLTLGPRAVSASKGAFAGQFKWGPANQRTLISNEDNLASRFGKPTDANAQYWFSAANFLSYSNALEVVRILNDASNANSKGESLTIDTSGQTDVITSGVQVGNEQEYENFITSGGGNAFFAKYPGSLGNGIEVAIATPTKPSTFEDWTYSDSFDGAPEGDEVHIAVVDGAGKWSGIPGTVLETFPFVSTVEGNTSADGSNNYYKEVVNRQSSYVWVGGETFDFSEDEVSETVSLDRTNYTETHEETGVTGTDATITVGFDLKVDSKLYVEGDVSGELSVNRDASADQITVDADSNGETVNVYQLNETITVALTTEDFDSDDSINITLAGQPLVEGDYTLDYTNNEITIDPYNTQAVENAIDLSVSTQDAVVRIGGQIHYTLSGGQDDTSAPGLQSGYDLFSNSEESDISLVITGPASQVESQYILENISETRKDCVTFISPEMDDVVNNSGNEKKDVIDFRNNFNASSYGFMDCNWKYQYDKYNDKFRWVPLNGDIAGLAANTDNVADPWFSIAGYNRGLIRGVVKLAWNPGKTHRDELYKNSINPVITEAGEGTLLYGDKTMLMRQSAFSRINVRRLFIVLEKTIASAAKYQLFEFNDEFTRAQFVNMIEPFLRDVQGRRGIYSFKIKADEDNNTPFVIDQNQFIGDIYIKPAKTINFITLNFIAVRTGVSFEEVIG